LSALAAGIPAAFSAASEFGLPTVSGGSGNPQPSSGISGLVGAEPSSGIPWFRHPTFASALFMFGAAGAILYIHPKGSVKASAKAGPVSGGGSLEGSV
jgi:hypothetical protein